jgi:hypothetical protein
MWQGMVGPRGRFTTQRSGATVVGGSGLLDGVRCVPRDGVHRGVGCRRALSVQRLHLVLVELALVGKHLIELLLDDVDTGVGCRRVLSVLLCLVRFLNLEIFLDLLFTTNFSACLFLMSMLLVLIVVVFSVLLLLVKLLRLVPCNDTFTPIFLDSACLFLPVTVTWAHF